MRAPQVSEKTTTLRDWIIVESDHDYFLVGYSVDSNSICRSAAIASLNAADMTCETIVHERYTLLPDPATGEIAQSLLTHFRINQSLIAMDATARLLADPNLLYLNFSNNQDAQAKIALANAYLTLRASEPMKWLTPFIGYLTTYDVDPYQLTVPLGLSDAEWQLMRQGKLVSVSNDVALRGWLFGEVLTMIVDDINDDSETGGAPPATAETGACRIPTSLLQTREASNLLYIYLVHRCLAEIKASKRE